MTAEVIVLSLPTGMSESTKQALLELLCFYNCEDTLPEDW
jgi:hypothetical protein